MSAEPIREAPPTVEAQPNGEQDWQRLSVGMLFVQPVRELIRALPFLVALVFAGHASSSQPPWSLIGVVVVVGLGVARWITTQYRITANAVEVRRGLLARKRLTVPRDRVRTVDVSAHPLQRVLGLVKVEIGTGTSDRKAAALALDGLPAARATSLRVELLHRTHGDVDRSDDSPVVEDELVRFDPTWIRYAPTTLSGAVTALFLLGLGWRISGEAHLHPDRIGAVRSVLDHMGRTPLWVDVVEVGLAVAVLVAVLSVTGYVIAFWGFRLTRHSGGSLHVARGLLTTRATSIEERRIRGAELSEPLLLRLAGGARCLAIATGLRVGRGSERGGTLLLPPAPLATAIEVESAVLGTPVPAAAVLLPRGTASRRRRYVRALWPTSLVVAALAVWALAGPLPGWIAVASLLLLPAAIAVAQDRFRSLAHALLTEPDGRRWLVTRYGSLVRRRCVLDADGVIGVTMRKSFFQRRVGLTSVIATTAAGRQHYPITDLTDAAASDLARQLVPAADAFTQPTRTSAEAGIPARLDATLVRRYPPQMSESAQLIPYDPTVHTDLAVELWSAADTAWALDPGKLRRWADGTVAVGPDGQPVGLVTFDPAGALEFLVVSPAHRRAGTGSALLSNATQQLADRGLTSLSTSDGAHAIWPGVPEDLPGATRLFDRAGWRIDHRTDDLTQDLADYLTPDGVFGVSTAAAITFAVEPSSDDILGFERTEFPSWLKHYEDTSEEILVARDRDGTVAGAALLDGPGLRPPFSGMLGDRAAGIGCVGVVAARHGNGIGTALVARGSEILRDRGARVCHISWTTRASFYESLGYVRWRSYRMYQRP